MGDTSIYGYGASELGTVAVRQNCAFPGSAAGDWSEPRGIQIPARTLPSTPTVFLGRAHACVPGSIP